jgi:hypothetical protein
MEDRYTWSRRWMEAQRDAASDDAGRRAAVTGHLNRMKPLVDRAKRLRAAGLNSAADVAAATWYAAEAEHWHAETARN